MTKDDLDSIEYGIKALFLNANAEPTTLIKGYKEANKWFNQSMEGVKEMNRKIKIREMRNTISDLCAKGEKCLTKDCIECACCQLYNAGYRKIGKNQVIVDIGLWNKIPIERTDKEKEVAKEILDEVSKHYGGAWLVELYKKYGVDYE